MARRTKEDAHATRQRCWTRRSACSWRRACPAPRCNDIAAAAGATRGADLLAFQGQGRPVQRDDGAGHAAAGARAGHR